MPVPLTLPWSDDLLSYNFGVGHPMAPVRLRLTFDLIQDFGLLTKTGVSLVASGIATDDVLCRVHEREYIAAVRAAGLGTTDTARGLGTEDNPIFEQIHEASAAIVAATVAGADAVSGAAPAHAVSLAGGMHHAMPGRAAGFCVYNDVAAGIARLLDNGAERVLYIDIDAHHGDGVERIFWDDPRVVTLSIHQSGQSLFPGTGFPQDLGGPRARGSAVNIPVPPQTGDGAWLRALEAVAAPLVAEFAPEVIVSQHGCDAHHRDPLTGLDISVDAQREAARMIASWAHDFAQDRWLATGGGGYDLIWTVPRVWTHLVAVALGEPLPVTAQLPPAWLTACEAQCDGDMPQSMGDGRPVEFRRFADGFDPADPVDRVVMATRRAVFPFHGLDPMTAE